MPARDLPNLGLKAGYDPGENGWGDDMTENLLKLSTLTQATVIDKVAATPGSPAAGDVYLFSAAHPTNANDIAIFDGPTGEETWTYVTPDEGWLVFNKAADYYEKFDGSAWAELATGGGGGGGIADAPADGKLYGRQDNDWEEIISGDGDGVAVVYEETLSTGLALNAHRQIDLPSGFNRFRIVIEIPTVAAINPEFRLQVGGSDVTCTHHRWASENTTDDSSGTTILSLHSSAMINSSSPTVVAELEKEADGRWRLWGSIRSKQIEGFFAGKTSAAAVLTSFSAGSSNGVGFPAGTYIRVERPGSAGDVVHPFRGARVARTADQAVASGSQTVAWTTETYDLGGWHDNAVNNSRLVVPAGVKRVEVMAQLDLTGPGNHSLRIHKNGTSIAVMQVGASGYTYTVPQVSTGVIDVVPGDYFEVQIETGGGSSVRSGRSFFAIKAVSDKVSRADLSPTLNAQAASYSLVAADDGNIVEMTSASANTVTLPANATTGIEIGSTFSVVQIGTGVTTIQAAAGVMLNGVSEGSADISGQWGGVSLYKRGPDQWVIQGAHGGVS